MDLGKRIQELRKARNETLEDVAKGAGTTKSYIWELENKGPARPSLNISCQLADHFGLTLDALVGREVVATGKVTIRNPDGATQTFNIIEAREPEST